MSALFLLFFAPFLQGGKFSTLFRLYFGFTKPYKVINFFVLIFLILFQSFDVFCPDLVF